MSTRIRRVRTGVRIGRDYYRLSWRISTHSGHISIHSPRGVLVDYRYGCITGDDVAYAILEFEQEHG